MANVLVFEASQTTDKVNACRYALLKYLEVYNLKPPSHIAIYVYTDQPAVFEAFIPFFQQFAIKEISQAQIKEWQGETAFSSRVKMEIIAEVFKHIEGNLIFLDSTTYIKMPLEELFKKIEDGSFLLHSFIGSITNSSNVELNKLFKFLSADSIRQNGNNLSTNDVKLWNAKVVGLNSQSKIIDDILELTDVVHKQFPKSIVESFAFSYCFQKTGDVITCDNTIFQYGKFEEFKKLLHHFFKKNEEESVPNLVKLIRHLDAATVQKEKATYEALPFYKKWLQALTGKNWIKQYQNKF
ncbi:MAG: hypothetical protein ACTHOF_01035 [Flavisolibacter sp.]|jgi:hypothetical protein